MALGRFAPSPSGRLHVGNLRTALLAWLFARAEGSEFLLRFEDLDPNAIRPEHYQTQLEDLEALGITWDGEPLRQSARVEIYRHYVKQLVAMDVTYPCYCSRKDIRLASQAPNGPTMAGGYPGTCRHLSQAQRSERRAATGREPAIRVRAASTAASFDDELCGPFSGAIDDVVIQRNDGTPAYNLVVVIDDHLQGVEQVVRGDDLLDSTPRQMLLANLLDIAHPRYAHVPLVLGPLGSRLAKSDGSVSLADRLALGETTAQVLRFMAESLGLACEEQPNNPADGLLSNDTSTKELAAQLLAGFDPTTLPRQPLRLTADYLHPPSAPG